MSRDGGAKLLFNETFCMCFKVFIHSVVHSFTLLLPRSFSPSLLNPFTHLSFSSLIHSSMHVFHSFCHSPVHPSSSHALIYAFSLSLKYSLTQFLSTLNRKSLTNNCYKPVIWKFNKLPKRRRRFLVSFLFSDITRHLVIIDHFRYFKG